MHKKCLNLQSAQLSTSFLTTSGVTSVTIFSKTRLQDLRSNNEKRTNGVPVPVRICFSQAILHIYIKKFIFLPADLVCHGWLSKKLLLLITNLIDILKLWYDWSVVLFSIQLSSEYCLQVCASNVFSSSKLFHVVVYSSSPNHYCFKST